MNAMKRMFALLAVCISLQIASVQPASVAQPAELAQPILSSMPPKRKRIVLAMRGKSSSTPPKRKRTTLDMRGNKHVTQAALSHICKDIERNGLVKATSARTMRRNRSAVANQDTPFGKLIQEQSLVTKKGGTMKIPFLHPAAMLWVCCRESNEFKMFFSSVLEGQPRLKLVEYTDEVTPGRELVSYNDKKVWVLYWSFLEFGSAALANENAWFTGAVVKSSIVRNNIAGGMGQIFKVYNKMFFSAGCDFRSGILMNVPRSPAAPAHAHVLPDHWLHQLIFADLSMVVQDAEAHAFAFDWLGAGSAKCCPLCWNIVSKNCNLVHDPTGTTIPVWTADTSLFKLMSRRLFRRIQNSLKDTAETKSNTKLLEKQSELGFKYNPHSWLQDEGLDVNAMDVIAFDVMHCWCQGGAWEIELVAGLDELSQYGHGGRELHVYLQKFQWPRAYASGKDLCKGSVYERAKPKDCKPTGSASEFMSAGPAIRKWLEDVIKPKGLCPLHVASLLRCIDVLYLLSQIHTGHVTSKMLAEALAIHYAAHVIAYGYTLFVPKHHFMLHIPAQLDKFTMLIMCYVHERKHKVVKRWAVPLCPTKGNNRSLLEECTLAHIKALQDPLLKPCLLEQVKAEPNVVAALKDNGFTSADTALTGRTARVQGKSIQKGDVALFSDGGVTSVGEIYWFASVGSELFVGISTWPVKRDFGSYRKVRVEENFSIIPGACLLQAMIFTPTDVGKLATVLLPAL